MATKLLENNLSTMHTSSVSAERRKKTPHLCVSLSTGATRLCVQTRVYGRAPHCELWGQESGSNLLLMRPGQAAGRLRCTPQGGPTPQKPPLSTRGTLSLPPRGVTQNRLHLLPGCSLNSLEREPRPDGGLIFGLTAVTPALTTVPDIRRAPKHSLNDCISGELAFLPVNWAHGYPSVRRDLQTPARSQPSIPVAPCSAPQLRRRWVMNCVYSSPHRQEQTWWTLRGCYFTPISLGGPHAHTLSLLPPPTPALVSLAIAWGKFRRRGKENSGMQEELRAKNIDDFHAQPVST